MTHIKLAIITIFLCSTSVIYGQLGFCGGSTGDAIFTESFGNGTNFGPPLAPGLTTYPFVTGFPNDGFYTLNYLTGLNSSWHNSLDHSPDNTDGINGKCLIVNANNVTSGAFYRRTVSGLCINTTFEFSAWLMNVYNPLSNVCTNNQIPINVRFEIWNDTETVLLGSGNTGNIFGSTSPLWQQFALVFTTSNETSVVLIMKNNGVGGCGNDLAIDDIAFKSCGDLTTVSNPSFPTNNFTTCDTSATVPLTAATSGSSTYFYQWQSSTDNDNWTDVPGANTNTFTTPGVSVTTYFRTKIAQDIANINSPFCSAVSNIFTVTILPQLTPPISNGNVVICSSQPIPPISVTSSNTVNWYDQPTGGNLLLSGSNSYTPTAAGTFYAEVFNPTTGCFGSSRTAVSLTITQEPIASFTGNLNYCSGETTAISLQSDVVGTTFSWTIVATNVTGAVAGSGDTISQNLVTNSPSGTVTYLVTPSFNSCPGTPISITVNVYPLPSVIFSSSSDSVCSNQTTDLLFSGTPGAIINFTDGNNNFSTTMNALGTGTFTTAPLTVDTTFTLTSTEITNVVTCSQNSMGSIIITINANTAITSQPVGSTICNNGTVTFNVGALGDNLTYQWFLNGTAIPSATASSYTITSANTLDAGDYTVQVTGSCGSVLSNIATLNITPIITVITPPQATTTVCVGQPLSLNVNTSGSGLSYQWYFGTTLLPGEINPTFNISSVDVSNAGTYSIVISNSCENVNSTNAVVIVNDLPIITNQPQNTTLCEGQPINLSVVATGAQLSYQWLKNGVAIPGAIASVYTIPVATLSDAAAYSVTVNGLCGTLVLSTIATVTINQTPIFIQPPSDMTVCSGQTVTLTVATAGGTNVTYQWFNGTTSIAGATSPTLTIANATVSDSGNYTCQVTSDSCGTITSSVAVVIVNQAPGIASQSGNQEICAGQALNLQVTTTGTNLTYQWFKGNSPIAGANSSTYNVPNATQIDSGDYFVEIASASCPTFTSTVISVIVNPLPFATISAGPPAFICEGESTQVIFNGSADAIVTYTVNGGTPQSITLNAGAATILATGTLTETSVYELVSVTSSGVNACSQALTGSATITVNPLPNVTLKDGKICVDPISLVTTRNYFLNTGLNEAEFTFEWFDVNGLIPLATNSFYEVSVSGQYSVTITDIATGCQASAFANVDESAPPTDFTYSVSNFFSNNPTIVITPTPIGEYEFQLDFGPFQDSNTFENISAGTHTVTVRDEEACGILTKEILIVDYPRFFTPNGDGINDTWNITSIGNVSISKIYIFDQFGKLIKEMTPSSTGWDGTYNGQNLPSTDYWFMINYQEAGLSKEFRSHFSLKR